MVFGQIPKTRPTHATLPGADTDSIMTEKNTIREQKEENQTVHPTIKIPNPHKEIKTEKIQARQLPREVETSPMLSEGNNWLNDDWAQNDWEVNYYSWAMPTTGPMYWGNNPETQN